MSVTWFAPLFLCLFVWACRGERQWVAATVVATFFQAASPILFVAGGRNIGMQPAYLLLPVGLTQFFMHAFRPRAEFATRFRLNGSHLFMLGLTVISVVGAFMLPRVFGGFAHVMTPRGAARVVLHGSSGNMIQAMYVISNFVLFALVAAAVHRGAVTASQCIRYLAVGTTMAAGLGIYQVVCNFVHLPWPDMVINSNLGVAQLFNQKAFGSARRMSSTFLEPSMFAMHFLGMFALFNLGMHAWKIGTVVLLCLLVSTSATAYAGLLALMGVWIAFHIGRHGLGMGTAVSLCLAASLIVAILIAMSFGYHDLSGSNYVSQKLSSSSGQMRIKEDMLALHTFVESWGLGVGVGSTRASSLITTFLASTGILGLVCLFGFFGSLIFKALAADVREVRALGLALTALFVGWLISVPDLAMPMIWTICGIISGSLSRVAQRTPQFQDLPQTPILRVV